MFQGASSVAGYNCSMMASLGTTPLARILQVYGLLICLGRTPRPRSCATSCVLHDLQAGSVEFA
jgi:hypothetical protein